MTPGRQTGSGRAATFVVAGCCLAVAACQQPKVGDRFVATEETGPRIVITGAWVGMGDRVVTTLSLFSDGRPVSGAAVAELQPRFTLATLSAHPVDQLPAWRSHVLTGAQVVPSLPLTPPGADPRVSVTDARQPGAESLAPGSLADLGGGEFIYAFATPLAPYVPDETIRIGVWLDGAPATKWTSSTYDFRGQDGAKVDDGAAVLDEGCATCHGTLIHHARHSGVRLCATCHTWQNADPDTADPAAMHPASRATDPNPLELGRLIHRIHRGKDLPTAYASTWKSGDPSTVPSAAGLPLPFQPTRSGGTAPRNTPVLGRKYSVVGENGHEAVYAQSLTVATYDPTPIGTMAIVAGGMFPRDLRDCAVCHGGAPREDVVTSAVSRRTCSGCHPEVWFQGSSPAADPVRFPHPGGAQADDSRCLGCHVDGTTAGPPKLYAPIAELHVPPTRAPRYDKPVIEILKVEDLAPGKRPKVTYRLSDRVGPIAPKPNAPAPGFEPDHATSSYVPRRLTGLVIRIMGPTTPDYAYHSSVQLTSGAEQRESADDPDWDPLDISTVGGTDEYVYTFTSTIPPGATGTYVVGMEARRFAPSTHYDRVNDVFQWPYTGETINETAENALVYVNSASGVWPPPPGSPAPVPRRTVVDQEKCLRCHDRIEFHGQRNAMAWCVTCHAPDNTDWEKRNKGNAVSLGATYDGIEERSTHFKMMIHRTHTGSRKGVASLEGIAPYVVYYGKAYFFDRGGFPNDLRDCTVCHAGKTYLLDNLPADAPPTLANERAEIRHAPGAAAHPFALGDEPATPPMQAACTGCHASAATFWHVASRTVGGVESCTSCHSKGPVSVEEAHGLVPLGTAVGTSFSAIVQQIIVPRCATAACHSGSPPVAFPQLDADAAYGALVGAPSGQAPMQMVEPGAPERSYLLYKLRGDAASAGGTPSTPMPTDGLLDPADVAAIEAWIANGAQND